MAAVNGISHTSTPSCLQNTSRQSSISAVIATLQRWWVAYLTWRLEQAAISQLSAFSDRELKDMGLNRSGIPAAVRGEAPWRLRRYY